MKPGRLNTLKLPPFLHVTDALADIPARAHDSVTKVPLCTVLAAVVIAEMEY